MNSFRLAWSSLVHQRGRTAISVTGAAFAVLLIFMQLGFLGAVENTATLLYDEFRFDLIVMSNEYIDMSRPGEVPRDRLAQAGGAPGVARVDAVTLGNGMWRNPTADPERGGKLWQLLILGINPGSFDAIFARPEKLFDGPDDQERKRQQLSRLETVLMDERSRPDFGVPSEMPPGTRTELNGQTVELAGYFRAGTGFSYTGLLMTSEQSLSQLTAKPLNKVTFVLVQLQPGVSVQQAQADLIARLPGDVRVARRDQIADYERNYWVNRTAVGKFFYFGVLLAITVGGIFIYQMMVADIKKHLPEYATLKSMGYRFGFLFRIVLGQALLLAVGGYILGLAASLLCYELTRRAASMPIGMTLERILLVLGLTVLMCVGSGLLAVRKVQTADPADLF